MYLIITKYKLYIQRGWITVFTAMKTYGKTVVQSAGQLDCSGSTVHNHLKIWE